MKKFSKLLSILLCLSLVLSFMPTIASANTTVTYDFTKITESNSTSYTTSNIKDVLNSCADDTSVLTSVSKCEKIYPGNPTGGPKTGSGFLKASSSTVNGELTLVFNQNVTKVEIVAWAWKSGEGKFSVNGSATQDSSVSGFGTLTFEIAASDTVAITVTKRALIQSISVTFADGSSVPSCEHPNATYNKEMKGHQMVCADCKTTGSVVAHSFTNKKCTVCGFELYTPAHLDKVTIYYPAGDSYISGTASGAKLAAGDALELVVVVDEDGNYSFVTAEGMYLTSAATGSGLSLTTEATEYSLWVLEEAANGWYIKNVNAAYNGAAQYIEYYSGFTTYSLKETSDVTVYTYQFAKTGTATEIPVFTCPHSTVEDYVCQDCQNVVEPESGNTLSIPDANKLGLAVNGYTTGSFYVSGTIQSIDSTTYGNMTIVDDQGNTLYIYGTYDADGTNRYDAMTNKPVVGDTVTVYGVIGQYNGTAQMKDGRITAHTAHTHTDTTPADHNCDICGAAISDCADTNPKDHKCDVCGAVLSDCADTNPKDHKCDVCGAVLSECADTNPKDHKCDVCGATLSECADTNPKDHNCDVCGAVLSECADTNPKDHNCDVCGAVLSEHAEGDTKDHKCDYCDATISTCEDANDDNICDTCGKALCINDHVDENHDHICDACTGTASTCSDSETDTDHLCDICGKKLNECSDATTDTDHLCDVCGKKLSDCSDVTTDSDHKCDVCGESCGDHSFVKGAVTAPTCTAKGYTTYTCNCGASEKRDETDIIDHTWDAGKVTTEPTTTTEGVKTFTCSVCGTTKTEKIAKLPEPTSTGVTITFDDTAKRTEFSEEKQVWTENGITVTNSKGDSTSNVADYSNPARFYKNSSLTIAYNGIETITFNCSTEGYATALVNALTGTDYTVTTNGTSVTVTLKAAADTFTVILEGGQVRISSIDINKPVSTDDDDDDDTSSGDSTTVPGTLAEQIAQANKLSNGAYLSYTSTITGTITDDPTASTYTEGTYKFTVSDGTNTLLCYYTPVTGGTPAKGDTVTVTGYLTAYNGSAQFDSTATATITKKGDNTGSDNTGSDNTGSDNTGSGNTGSDNTGSGSTEGAAFTKVTSLSDITSGGQYVIVAEYDGKYYVMSTTVGENGKIEASEITVSGTTLSGSALPVWTIAPYETGVSLNNGSAYLKLKQSTSVETTDTAYLWTVVASDANDGSFKLIPVDADTRGLSFRMYKEVPQFGTYALSNETNDYSAEYTMNLAFYKLTSGTVTPPSDDNKEDGSTTPSTPSTPSTKYNGTLLSELKDGDQIVIYSVANGSVMTPNEFTYEGSYTKIELEQLEASVNGDVLTYTMGAVVLTVHIDGDTVSFTAPDGTYLYADGTDVKFVKEAGENTKFVLEAAEGGYYIRCATATYNDKPQYLEVYSGYFTCYGMGTNTSIYTFQFYAADPDTPAPTGDSTISVVFALLLASVMGTAVVISKKKEF